MNILVGKTFGIGNTILCVPLVKALRSMGHKVDVLVGSGPDDFGAFQVMLELQKMIHFGNIFLNHVDVDITYDVAIMTIPFDGRWQNGRHFAAMKVMDCRKRPDNVDRLGFDMWKKHESEYIMENAHGLGYVGKTPSTAFMLATEGTQDTNLVYVGLGYKRDAGGFGESKHFGNARYARLISSIRERNKSAHFTSTGGVADLFNFKQIVTHEMMNDPESIYRWQMLDLENSFKLLSRCSSFIGNDTGLMHAAASFNMPTVALMAYPELAVKNPPFCDKSLCINFNAESKVEDIADRFVQFVWG